MNEKMEMKTVTEEKKGERGKKKDMDKESFRSEGKLKRELYSTEQSGVQSVGCIGVLGWMRDGLRKDSESEREEEREDSFSPTHLLLLLLLGFFEIASCNGHISRGNTTRVLWTSFLLFLFFVSSNTKFISQKLV